MPASDFWREIRDYNRASWRWWLLLSRHYRARGVPGCRLREFVSYARHSHGKARRAGLQLRKAVLGVYL
jgi:hypothetical protein